MTAALVFDIDNTLTPPREALARNMALRLIALRYPFALAAGSDPELLMSQFFEPLHGYGYRGEFDAFLCNGASRYRCRSGSSLVLEPVDEFSLRSHLGDTGFRQLHETLLEVLADARFALPERVNVVGERIIDRTAMINLAPSGRERGALSTLARQSRDAFVDFDAQTGYRARTLPLLRAALDAALPGNDLRLTLGGQTSFDIVARGRDKSFAVRSLLEDGMHHVTYVGDALFPGGNDAAVLEWIAAWPGGNCPVEVMQVRDVAHTAELMDQWTRRTRDEVVTVRRK
jgi:hydroxymethylpyrimidine pyrophosphatase-like HAD family hydrolase